MDISAYLDEKKNIINAELEKILEKRDGLNSTLTSTMHYAVFPGGKRIRPVLAMAAAEAIGGDAAVAVKAGCAVELVHCSSLVHDDLPAMDNDDLRRGKPTVHKIVSEGVAILVGDALMVLPLEIITETEKLPPEVVLRLVRELAQAIGRDGIIGGQTVDLESEGKEITRETLRYIHQHKTADLIAVAVRMGAISARGSGKQLASLTTYGNSLGLLFQVIDDILDVTGDTGQLGKTAGSDEGLKKATYPAVVGLERSREIAATLAEEAHSSLASFDEKADPLRKIIELVLVRNS
jgi:geranylgeranyl diphosphate synthase, type II